jgi:hypothetical protein
MDRLSVNEGDEYAHASKEKPLELKVFKTGKSPKTTLSSKGLSIRNARSSNYGITTVSIACITPFEASTSVNTIIDFPPLASVKITFSPSSDAVRVFP